PSLSPNGTDGRVEPLDAGQEQFVPSQLPLSSGSLAHLVSSKFANLFDTRLSPCLNLSFDEGMRAGDRWCMTLLEETKRFLPSPLSGLPLHGHAARYPEWAAGLTYPERSGQSNGQGPTSLYR